MREIKQKRKVIYLSTVMPNVVVYAKSDM